MTSPKTVLIRALRSEVEKLQRVQQEILDDQREFSDHEPQLTHDLRGIASVLTDLYQGAENALQRIARATEEGLPSGPEWHRLLLDQMTREVGEVRPPVISSQTRLALEDFRKFRHRARHMYGFDLEWKDVGPLLQVADKVINSLVNDLEAFCDLLEQIDEEGN